MADTMGLVATLLMVLLFGPFANAQMIKAEIVGEFPYVYAQPDFDAPVITTLKVGALYTVSRQQYTQGFRRIQLPNKRFGFISSSEIRIGGHSSASPVGVKSLPKKSLAENKEDSTKETPKKFKHIAMSRFRGLILENQYYTESTMSKLRSEMLGFIGFRVVGFNTMFSGQTSTDAAILFHFGSPKYYEKITGIATDGWILNAHFTFDTLIPISHSVIASYGFGPMFKYSHFQAGLKSSSGSGINDYVLDDMTLGVLFRVGAGFRWNIVSIRADIKYFIESQRYIAGNISTLFEF